MLATASEYHRRQAQLLVMGQRAARRAWDLGQARALTATIATLQAQAARESMRAVETMLAEQDIDAPAEAEVAPSGFAGVASDGRPLGTLLEQADSSLALETMTITQVADVGRIAAGVATTVRPRVQGYIRTVGPSCCSRCAVLAGRFYRWSSDFKRHPRCRCTMTPTDRAPAADLIEDPASLFRQGRITDLSQAQRDAIVDGADISRVVNATTRKGAVYSAGGVRMTREAVTRRGTGRRVRLTPESIYQLASDRAEAIRLLGVHGYIR